MKLRILLETAPAILRREVLKAQQVMLDMGWDDAEVKFTESNTGYPVGLVRLKRDREGIETIYWNSQYAHAKQLTLTAYYVPPDQTDKGHELVVWENPASGPRSFNSVNDLAEIIKAAYWGADQ